MACQAVQSEWNPTWFDGIVSGGGYSTLHPIPAWQASALAGYNTAVTGTAKAPFNAHTSGRGYPDVSLLARNYITYVANTTYTLHGTSASAPVFAGMVSLVNAHRAANSKSALGWLNPALYARSASFVRDITSGDNKCTSNKEMCCQQGFSATTGWDPVTGLGSVDFKKFLASFSSITPNTAHPTPGPKDPTIAPSMVPPTAVPTREPTKSKGFMYQTVYSGENCQEGQVVMREGLATGKCFSSFKGMNMTNGVYFKFSCGQGE